MNEIIEIIEQRWAAFHLWNLDRKLKHAIDARCALPRAKQERLAAIKRNADDAARYTEQKSAELDLELAHYIEELQIRRVRMRREASPINSVARTA